MGAMLIGFVVVFGAGCLGSVATGFAMRLLLEAGVLPAHPIVGLLALEWFPAFLIVGLPALEWLPAFLFRYSFLIGGIWAFVLLIPIFRGTVVRRGLVLSLIPTAFHVALYARSYGQTIEYGVKLTHLPVLYVALANAIWAILTLLVLKLAFALLLGKEE